MNSWEQERAEQEQADALEEARVEREGRLWREAQELDERDFGGITSRYRPGSNLVSPYLFADEGSQRRAEEEASFYGPIDDYASFQDQPPLPPSEQLFR